MFTNVTIFNWSRGLLHMHFPVYKQFSPINACVMSLKMFGISRKECSVVRDSYQKPVEASMRSK